MGRRGTSARASAAETLNEVPPVPGSVPAPRRRPKRTAWRTIVDPKAVHRKFKNGRPPADLLLIDTRYSLKDAGWGRRAYEEGHVPGAVFADVDRDLSAPVRPQTGRHPLPDVDDFVETASRWGIDDDVQVVCYDDFGGAWASRAWWLLRYYGHPAVAVMDGGIQAWTALGYKLTTSEPKRRRRAFPGRPGFMPTVTTWDIMTRAPRCLVDARGPTRYRGDEEPVDPVAGHIPHAVNVPFAENTDKDGRFLPAEMLRAKFERALNGLPASEAAFYCGSGVTAPHDILAMEVAGLPGAALYPGSWSEWIRNPMRPVARGDEP